MNVKRRICFTCNNSNRGQLIPNPRSKNKEELIWICDVCYGKKKDGVTTAN